MKKLGLVLIIALLAVAGGIFLRLDNRSAQNVAAKKAPKSQNNRNNLRDSLSPADISSGNILCTGSTQISLRVLHKTIPEYYKDDRVEAIVEGTISNVEYTHSDASILTIVTVDVLKTFKGQTEKTILVIEDGGFAKYKDIIKAFEGHIDMSKITKDKMNGIVEEKVCGAPHPIAGQQVVLFLHKNPGGGAQLGLDPSRTYGCVSSVFGKFVLDNSTGVYKRFEDDTKDDPSDKSAVPIKNAVPFETTVSATDLSSRLKGDN